MYRFRSLVVLLVGIMVLCACTGTPAAQIDSNPSPVAGNNTSGAGTLAEASPAVGGASGKLVVYSTRAESLIKPVLAAFGKAYPNIEVVLLTGQNGELAAKLLEETANPQAGVFVNTDSLTMSSLAADGVFESNTSDAVTSMPASYRADDGSWVGLTLRPRVIMYNTNLVTPDEAPKSVFELTDPKWKGQVGSSNSTNGSMQAHIVAIGHLLGAAQAEEFVRGLVGNDTEFFGGHTDVRKAVGAGELKLGLVNHYYYHLSKAEGAPVGIVYPDQGDGQMGLVVNSSNVGIVKGGPNPDAAKAFVDFLLTPEGQKVFAEVNFEYPVVPGVPLAEGVQPLDDLRLADISLKTIWEELAPGTELMQRAGLP